MPIKRFPRVVGAEAAPIGQMPEVVFLGKRREIDPEILDKIRPAEQQNDRFVGSGSLHQTIRSQVTGVPSVTSRLVRMPISVS